MSKMTESTIRIALPSTGNQILIETPVLTHSAHLNFIEEFSIKKSHLFSDIDSFKIDNTVCSAKNKHNNIEKSPTKSPILKAQSEHFFIPSELKLTKDTSNTFL